MIAGILWVLFVAYYIGKKERSRLGIHEITLPPVNEINRPKLIWVNLLLTVTLLVSLIMGVLPLAILFMIALSIALIVNYPNVADQRKRLASHAGNALSVGSIVFAAGIFTGILTGTKMLDAMGQSFLHIIPDALGPNMSLITAFTSMPFTFFMSNDAYYFGIVPLTAKAASHFGISVAEIGRSSLLGQSVHLMSPLVASTYLLLELTGVNFSDHQRYTLKWAVGTVLVMIFVSVVSGVIRIHF